MRRSTAVTVCILTGDDRRVTRPFLDRIAGELGPHDNLVLVAPGRNLDDPSWWRTPGERGALKSVSTDHAPRPRPVVVIVDDRVEAGSDWLELLLDPFVDESIGAAAPLSNVADGDELYVGVPYRPYDIGRRRGFVRELAIPDSPPREVDLLDGPCIAVRREHVEALGGLAALFADGYDPATISRTVAGAGGRCVVATGCYLHHPGGPTKRPDPTLAGRPLITACMIVKDEAQNLPRCLASIEGFADEIVIYDTGSSDATIEIAEAAGAIVHRGYWDDDFGRARNDALANCRGQWILWVDADETLDCHDPHGARSRLAELPSAIEAYIVLIDNLNGNEAAVSVSHPACRLFRRALGHWQGHLHELIVARAGNPELERILYNDARISHRGYLQSAISSRSKGQRNLRTAFGDLAGGSELDWSVRLTSLGRSYAVVGQFAEAIDHCIESAALATNPSTRRLALRTVIDCRLALGQLDEAFEELAQLRAVPGSELLASLLEGRARQASGEHELALACFNRVLDAVDDDGFEFSRSMVAVPTAESLRALGRFDDAADALIASLVASGGADAHLGLIIEILEQAERPLVAIYDALGNGRIDPFVPQLLQLQPDVADRTLEAWQERNPASHQLLAAAAKIAPRLEIARQLIWSSRLRGAGLPGSCPLIVSAANSLIPARDRVLAATVALTMFSDGRGEQVFGAAVCALDAAERPAVRLEVAAIAADLMPRFDELASGRPRHQRYDETPLGRRVLVVDREIATLRSLEMATRLALTGHRVTLVHPLPASSSLALLDPFGVIVRGWVSGAPDGDAWIGECERALAQATSEQSFDAVIIARAAAAITPVLHRLLPRADLVLDLDNASLLPQHSEQIGTVFAARHVVLDRPVVEFATAAADVLPIRAHVPLEARRGVVVVGNLRSAPSETLELLRDHLAPALRRACNGIPLALLGDDPENVLATALPGSPSVGAVADPSPWIASARAVLVTHEDGAEQWLNAAAEYGTPALVVPPDAQRSAEVVAAVRALAIDEPLWQRFAAGRPPAIPPLVREPFAAVPERPIVELPERERPEVRIVGGAYSYESLAQMNRELASHLVAAHGDIEVTMLTRESEPFPADSVRALNRVKVRRSAVGAPADVEIRHQWPPDFSSPVAGELVVWQPWEYGGLPASWIAPLRDAVSEFWVPTSWQRDCAIRSGVPEEKIQVVPYGVDVQRFHPEGSHFPLQTKKSVKLLFVGGLIERKGIDALLEVYLSSFSAADDVCLVIKPFGSRSVYRGASLEREVRQAAGAAGAEIEVVEDELGFSAMAALYRSCDVLVHPYRGEGFGMPIVEAMASGLPVVVPNGGACLDFCDDDNAWLVPAREVPIFSNEWYPSAAGSWWLEPSRSGLAKALRAAVGDADARDRKGRAGRERILAEFTWERTASLVLERVQALLPDDQRSLDHLTTAGATS